MTGTAPYAITFTPAARRRLGALPLPGRGRAVWASGRPGRREPPAGGASRQLRPFEAVLPIRHGDCRVLFTVDDRARAVTVLAVAPPARWLPSTMNSPPPAEGVTTRAARRRAVKGATVTECDEIRSQYAVHVARNADSARAAFGCLQFSGTAQISQFCGSGPGVRPVNGQAFVPVSCLAASTQRRL